MKKLHIVENGYIQPVLNKMRNEGVNVNKYIKESRLNIYNFESMNSFIPIELMYKLFSDIYKYQSIEFIDFLNDSVNVSDLSDNVNQIVSTPDLLNICQLGSKYNQLVVSNEIMSLDIYKENSILKITVNELLSLGHQLTIKMSMLYMLDGMRVATGKSWKPLEIHYQFKKPEKQDPFIDFGFNIDVKYDMPHSGFVFPTNDLSKYVSLENNIVDLENSGIRLTDKLTHILDSLQQNHIPNINYFSDLMDMSTRSFIRSLKKEDTSFFKVLDTWRFTKALDSLKCEETRIIDLAKQLGYSNHSNFERAFKRWTGSTPTNYQEIIL